MKEILLPGPEATMTEFSTFAGSQTLAYPRTFLITAHPGLCWAQLFGKKAFRSIFHFFSNFGFSTKITQNDIIITVINMNIFVLRSFNFARKRKMVWKWGGEYGSWLRPTKCGRRTLVEEKCPSFFLEELYLHYEFRRTPVVSRDSPRVSRESGINPGLAR